MAEDRDIHVFHVLYREFMGLLTYTRVQPLRTVLYAALCVQVYMHMCIAPKELRRRHGFLEL